jgi:chromosome segregation ATPase
MRRLREAQADTDATTATNLSKLSRITVQRDGLQARVTQLERELEDHKDNNAKLQRQLDNWQGLKKGDDADLDTLRKKNVELEAQSREANALIQERDKALEKEKGRTTKLKEVLHEWKVRFSLQPSLCAQEIDYV